MGKCFSIFHWAQSEVKRIRVTDAQCSSHAGSYKQLMYGLVVQKLAQVYGSRDITWEQAVPMNPSGGMIGYGATYLRLHKYLKRCKSFRLHAIFHDAMGFLYKAYGVGNGYDYVFGILPSFPLAGQVSGLLYWTYQSLKRKV